ncbi:MAG: tRNA pseudouridine(55) synthase TruB [Verrucomicrobia bacterium]|nr:tRNA pseudouridine(55) synthase TruB [Verrucomicrobiota bacterium]
MNGFLVIDKPAGITSHDVVDRARRILGIRKIGHLGTLDPLGVGVLVLAVGTATKAVRYFVEDEKEYTTTVKLGVITDTQDLDGTVVGEREVNVTREQFDHALERFKGEIEQIPPMVSAKKVGGKRLYKLHRQGIEVKREPKPVTIHEIDVHEFAPPNVTFHVHCSKGTYIRTLCADIGETLGCGGAMAWLRRTRSGFFTIDEAVTLEALETMSTDEIYALLMPTERAIRKRGVRPG